ncbi:hypothetical protein KUV57_16080 [Epibacterium sp. DP7N7-1]|nr:hypothetical protein [Epibacterium sp. DP7N7-1]
MTKFPSKISGKIDADEIHIGQGVIMEEGALITGKTGRCKRVHIGDFCYIGKNTKVMAPEFVIGDYSKLHENAFCHGVEPLRIGRNCWFGGGVILDCMGGLDIHDNVGVGAGSQLWTHAQFGDIVEGSRFHSHKKMTVGKDAWFVGHCLVSPVVVGPRSMAMLGSVVTSDMQENHIYGGSPAKNLTDKIGSQFVDRTVDEKIAAAMQMVAEFEDTFPEHRGRLMPVETVPSTADKSITYLELSTRSYTRRQSSAEVAFFQAYVPLIKLVPQGEPELFWGTDS